MKTYMTYFEMIQSNMIKFSESYSETGQISVVQLFAKIVNGFISIPPEDVRKPLIF